MDIIKVYDSLSLGERVKLINYINSQPKIDFSDENITLYDWGELNSTILSVRLYNCIRANCWKNEQFYMYKTITRKDMKRWRNIGPKTIDEFCRLRGY